MFETKEHMSDINITLDAALQILNVLELLHEPLLTPGVENNYPKEVRDLYRVYRMSQVLIMNVRSNIETALGATHAVNARLSVIKTT